MRVFPCLLLPGSIRGLFCLVIAFFTATASGAYRFDMVIFERPNVAVTPSDVVLADTLDTSKAVGSLNDRATSSGSLGAVAYTLRQKGLNVLEQISWVQSPRGINSDAWYTLSNGRLNGLIRVRRGRYLHVDVDLLLRNATSSDPIRAKLYRRMASGELHYLDHPKLGILIRAVKLRAPSKPDATDAATGEPKPAQPAGSPQPG